jgi:hypothetical protein
VHFVILSFSRFLNIGQEIIHEGSGDSAVLLLRVSLDLQSFFGLQTILAHVVGIFPACIRQALARVIPSSLPLPKQIVIPAQLLCVPPMSALRYSDLSLE